MCEIFFLSRQTASSELLSEPFSASQCAQIGFVIRMAMLGSALEAVAGELLLFFLVFRVAYIETSFLVC